MQPRGGQPRGGPSRPRPGGRPHRPVRASEPDTASARDALRSASRPASARRAAAPGGAKRTRAPQPNRFTGRATVLGLVLFALLLAYAYPVRIYLNQQAQIAELEASQASQRQRIKGLQDETAKWTDPTYIATQARDRLGFVKPGDTVYIVTGGGSTGGTADPNAGKATNTGPWFDQLWSSVRAADKPRPTN